MAETAAAAPPTPPEETEVVTCYCGACKVTITGDPALNVFCHCPSCRRFGGSIVQAAKLYPFDKVKVEGPTVSKDEAKLPESGSWRFGCSKCGGVVWDNKSHAGFAMIPAGLSQKPFKAAFHIHYGSKICPIADGLPKYETAPKSFGGDDKLVPE